MNCLMTAWHEHEAELRGWLRHRIGNAVDAEDLLQDVFLKDVRRSSCVAVVLPPDCRPAQASTGSPDAFHSGKPSSSRRALKPFVRSNATASTESKQYGPRQ